MGVLLLRHGEADWALVNRHGWPGAAVDWAPLTEQGRRLAASVAETLADTGITRILSSPMTRALQTAAIVSRRLDVPLDVEVDLREWLPDETFSWSTEAEVQRAYQDFLAHDGIRAPDHPLAWEEMAPLRERAAAVLRPHVTSEGRVLAVCHEVVIHALTGVQQTALCGARPYEPG